MDDSFSDTSDDFQEMELPTEAEWLKFRDDLRIYDSSSSSSGTPLKSEFDRIYVITDVRAENKIGYCVYSIDSNSSSAEIQPLKPIVYWDLEYSRVFTILGSKLYIFRPSKHTVMFGTTVYSMSIYDMRRAIYSPSSTPIDLDELQLEFSKPQMYKPKCKPVAVVISPSKICVFGTILYKWEYADEFISNTSAFELFDTVKGTWENISNPPFNYEDFDNLFVISYTVHRSCLIIHTIPGIFGINFDDPDPHWVILNKSEDIPLFSYMQSWTIVDNHFLTPCNVTRQGCPLDLKPIALKGHPLWRQYLWAAHGVLCFDDSWINLCIVKAGFLYNRPTLLVDVTKFDKEAVDKMGSDMSKWNEIQTDKSLSFHLTYDHGKHVDVIACFLTKVALESADGVMESADGVLESADGVLESDSKNAIESADGVLESDSKDR